jgi:hypothetical protein
MKIPKDIFLPKNKNVLLLFSGGLDSTYLLWKNLENGNTVTPIYVELKNNKNKSTIEKQQIKLIWNELREGYHEKLEKIKFIGNYEIFPSCDPVRMKQIPFWVISMLFAQDYKYHNEIHVGYVQEDGAALSYINDIKKMYYSFLPITDGLADLKFPLVKKSKNDIIRELPDNLFNLIITCENPIIKPYRIGKAFKYDWDKEDYRFWKPCGECEMCKKINFTDYFYTGKEYKTQIDEYKSIEPRKKM